MRNFTIKNILYKVRGSFGFIVLFILWSLLSRGLSSLVLPSPGEVAGAFYTIVREGKLLTNLLITFKRTLMGFLLAFSGGMMFALLMEKSPLLRKIFQPLVVTVQVTPPVVWLILAVVWFGMARELTPVFIVSVVVFPIILVNFLEGLDSFDRKLIQMARIFNSSKDRIFLHIILPGLAPYIISSTRVGFAFAWKANIFAEFFASSSGTGYMLSTASSLLDTAGVFAWAIVLILVVLGVDLLLINPLKRRVSLWLMKS